MPSVFRRTTRTWRLSLPPDQRGRKRLRPETVYFSTNSGLGDTAYRQTTRVVDGARQALLSVTGLFGTPTPKGPSCPIVSTLRRHQQEDNHCAQPALVDSRSRKHLTSRVLSCHSCVPTTLLRAAASQEGPAAPCAIPCLREGTAAGAKTKRHQARLPLAGKALPPSVKAKWFHTHLPFVGKCCSRP